MFPSFLLELSLSCIKLCLSREPGARRRWTYLTVVVTVVVGVVLLFNSLGCYFGVRWRKKRGQTGDEPFIPPSLSAIIICCFPQKTQARWLWAVMQLSTQPLALILSRPLFCLSRLSPLPPLMLSASTSSFKAVTSVFHPYLLSNLLALCPPSISASVSLYLFHSPLNLFSFLTFLCPLFFFWT